MSEKEKIIRCISLLDNNLKEKANIQITSPTGVTLGFYLHKPPITESPGEDKIDFFEIVSRVRLAWESRKKWEKENIPKDDDKIKWKVYGARVAHYHPPGLMTAYVNLSISDMEFLFKLHKIKKGENQ